MHEADAAAADDAPAADSIVGVGGVSLSEYFRVSGPPLPSGVTTAVADEEDN